MKPGGRDAVVFLSHQGGSFIDDLLRVAHALDFDAFCVCSTVPARAARIEHLREASDGLFVGAAAALTWTDVESALETLVARGIRPLACLTVWDGYRTLMARANAHLGAVDLTVEQIELLTDKHRMRHALRSAGLSAADSMRIETREDLLAAQALARPLFLKPCRGIGSFAASRLDPATTWSSFEKLRSTLRSDADCAGMFEGDVPFVAEDYIEGDEFSVEVLATDGEVFPLGIHEKSEMEERDGTVLELVLRSPPQRLSYSERARLCDHVRTVLTRLGIHTGCFHIELRLDRTTGSWEVIEINTRVGGGYVVQSVEASTGQNLLELWLLGLMRPTPENSIARTLLETGTIRERLDEASRLLRDGQEHEAVLFRVYYGSPGAEIDDISWNENGLTPAERRILVSLPAQLPQSNRELLVAQAFWRFPLVDPIALGPLFEKLAVESRQALEVRYKPAAAP